MLYIEKKLNIDLIEDFTFLFISVDFFKTNMKLYFSLFLLFKINYKIFILVNYIELLILKIYPSINFIYKKIFLELFYIII